MSEWRIRKMDPDSWTPQEDITSVKSVSITKAANQDDNSPLMESGVMELVGRIEEGYYRIESISKLDGITEVATLLVMPDDDEYSHRVWNGSASAKSVLTPANDVLFGNGEYAPKGCDGAAWVASKLKETLKSPVVVHGSFTLDNHIVFDLGSSHLSGCWAVLNTAGWCIQIHGDGSVHILEIPSEASIVFDSNDGSLLSPKITHKLPISDVPNVMKAYDGKQEAEAINDDPDSPTSTISRGRRIETFESSPARVNGETLAQYANRRLKELSTIYENIGITRAWVDGIYPYSCLQMNLPEAELVGTFTVLKQEIECSHGLHVTEEEGRRYEWF